MEGKTQELKSALTGQRFKVGGKHGLLLEEAKAHAASFAKVTEGIAVLSDFSESTCHTFSGKFGQQVFSLSEYTVNENSPFEDVIFNGTIKDDLLERHILELRFFNFIHSVPKELQTQYQMSCIIRFIKHDGTTLPVLHTSRYIQWDANGNAWLGFCTYIPLPIFDLNENCGIINTVSGEKVGKEIFTKNDSMILSRRQTEIISLLSKGEGSKQIADKLNISVHTVNRHRQDILAALKVSNTASAVEIALRLHLI